MKNFKKLCSCFLACVLIAFSFSFVACKDDDDDGNNGNSSPNKKQEMIVDFASNTNQDGECQFSWKYKEDFNVNKIRVKISSELGTETHIYELPQVLDSYSWKFDLEEDVVYNFEFTPYAGDKEGEVISCSRMNVSNLDECNFSRVEIETEEHIWPTCDYVSAPKGCVGSGIKNAEYVQSKVNIYNNANQLVYSSFANDEGFDGAKIKIRGNTSAYSDKKPYKLKTDKKVDLLSSFVSGRDDGKDYRSKDWVLLKGGDINQMIGSAVAETVGMDFVAEYEYVYLIVNGDFRGMYILSESVEQGNGEGEEQSRVAISDSGFIVEQDAYWWNEDLYFETPLTKDDKAKYTLKFPDAEDVDKNSMEYLYIVSYMSQFEDAIKDKEWYMTYIDAETFAKWILSHNILSTWDTRGTNIYFYKYDNTSSSKLCMGPLWDFDSIKGNGIESNARIYGEHLMFKVLFKDDEFCELYENLFDSVKGNILSNIQARIEKYNAEQFNKVLSIENKRWGSTYQNLEVQKESNLDWFEEHLDWMNDNI